MEKDELRYLHEQAERCRLLAGTCNDLKAAKVLQDMAVEYEERAKALGTPSSPPAG